jgi:peptidoglycan hydrolase-like protein with peptidoglycan-binding domain
MILAGVHYEPLSFEGILPARDSHKAVVFHTNGGGSGNNGDLKAWWESLYAQNREGICSHFQISKTGAIYQYVDTGRVAYAAYASNAFAVQVETEDDGNPATPWTEQQVAAAVNICKALEVPNKILANEPSDGVGWHSLYTDWNLSGHDCPGTVRMNQIKNEVLPELGKAVAHPYPYPGYPLVMNTSKVDPNVRLVQVALHIAADGVFGPITLAAVKNFQAAHHLTTDGIVGPQTWAALFG